MSEYVVVPLHVMKALGGKGGIAPLILELGTRRGEWSASRPGRALPPGKGPPGTHSTGGWVGPRAGLDTEDRGKTFASAGHRTSIARSVARHYTA
jgi:hypothetical protein